MVKNKGITLISLIITIIVLLILSAVVINVVIGKDGLIAKSNDAKEANNRQAAIEDVNFAWAAILLKYQALNDSTIPKSDYYTRENVNSYLGRGEIPDEYDSFEYNENGISTVIYVNNQNSRYIVEIDESGDATITGIAEEESSAQEGEQITTVHTLTLQVGRTYQITASSTLIWTNSNAEVCSIKTSNGVTTITATAEGTTTIVGKNENGNTVVESNITVTGLKEGVTYVWEKYTAKEVSYYLCYAAKISETSLWICSNLKLYTSISMPSGNNGCFMLKYGCVYNAKELNCCLSKNVNGRIANVYFCPTGGYQCDWNNCYVLNNEVKWIQAYSYTNGTDRWYIGGTLYSKKAWSTMSRGEYLEEVEDSSPVNYPTNGYQGGYWYVLKGVE